MSAETVSSRPVPRAGVLSIEAYVPGKSAAPVGVKLHKLSSNETPLGASPKAIAAYRAVAEKLEFYPDGGASVLREAIAQRYGLDAARIVCGAGSDELLNLITHAYIGPGDEGLYSEFGFLVYKIAITSAGGQPVVAKEKNYTTDVDAMLAAVTPRTKVVFLANPNNPTGTYLPAAEIERLADLLPPHVLLVLDAAYAEFVTRGDYESGLELARMRKNVVMTRTFSKIYGLAALRLGWATAAAPIIDAVNRLRGPFNINTPALRAGLAAVEDQEHIALSVAHNRTWLTWLYNEITELGIPATPGAANFLLLHFKHADEARAADAFLSKRGLILRAVDSYFLPQCLRLTVGTEEANRLVVDTLADFIKDPVRG